LIPLLVQCRETGYRAVVSTYTKTLQRQLIEKDFPIARRAAGVDVQAAVLMGRSNYICKRAVQRHLENPAGLSDATCNFLKGIPAETSGELESLAGITEIDAAIKRSIVCPAKESVCSGCRMRDDCILFMARKKALAADIVFVNHALLFSDLGANGALLGPYDSLVLDEAHHLADVATSFLTLALTPDAIRGSRESLYANEDAEWLSYAEAMAIAAKPEHTEEIRTKWKEFHAGLELAHRGVSEFFASLEDRCAGILKNENRGGGRSYGKRVQFSESSPLFYDTNATADSLKTHLYDLALHADGMVVWCDGVGGDAGCGETLDNFGLRVREIGERFDFLISALDEDYVFYVAADSDGRITSLSAAPVSVSAQLGGYFQDRSGGIILTSATLAVDGDFAYTLGTLGLSGGSRVDTRIFESPFDLAKQRKVCLATYLPDPRHETFIYQVSESISGLASVPSIANKKMLVLCTSHTQIYLLSRCLKEAHGLEKRILSQRHTADRQELIAAFRRSRNKILLGLASFWEGVDFPGSQLEIVVIVKTPFLVPDEPIVRARAERMRRQGEDAFTELFLPDAVLKLKQGFGRLIRTGRDRGVVVVLDTRLKEKSYGDWILGALTDDVVECRSVDELLTEVASALAE
jgi:ATP-dependent DNA helicase DinG